MDESAPADLGFRWRRNKRGEVRIHRHGRLAATLRAARAVEFVAEIAGAGEHEAQQLMARMTGNYKRGNERLARNHPQNR